MGGGASSGSPDVTPTFRTPADVAPTLLVRLTPLLLRASSLGEDEPIYGARVTAALRRLRSRRSAASAVHAHRHAIFGSESASLWARIEAALVALANSSTEGGALGLSGVARPGGGTAGGARAGGAGRWDGTVEWSQDRSACPSPTTLYVGALTEIPRRPNNPFERAPALPPQTRLKRAPMSLLLTAESPL